MSRLNLIVLIAAIACLITSSLIAPFSAAQAQEEGGEILFEEDFESPIRDWNLQQDWRPRELPDGNHVLESDSRELWAAGLKLGQGWLDYTIQTRVRFVNGAGGGLVINGRVSRGRYMLGLTDSTLQLQKQADIEQPQFTPLARATAPVSLSDGAWHTVSFTLKGSQLQAAVDGETLIDVEDPDPLRVGTVRFDANLSAAPPDAVVQIDDVVILNREEIGGTFDEADFYAEDGTLDKQALIETVDQALAQNQTLVLAWRYDDALSSYRPLLELVRKYQDHEAFANDPQPTPLHIAEFDVLLGLGEAMFGYANRDNPSHHSGFWNFRSAGFTAHDLRQGYYHEGLYEELDQAYAYFREAEALAADLPDDPMRMGRLYFNMGGIYQEYLIWNLAPTANVAVPTPTSSLTSTDNVAMHLGKIETFGKAAEAFQQAGEDDWYGIAVWQQSMAYFDLAHFHGSSGGYTHEELFQHAIATLTEAMAFTSAEAHYGEARDRLRQILFDYAYMLEMDVLTDEDADTEAMLNRVVELTQGENNTKLVYHWRGLAHAMLAWRNQDTNQAWSAASDLFAMAGQMDPADAWQEYPPLVYHYLGRMYYLLGRSDWAATYLAEAEHAGPITISRLFPGSYPAAWTNSQARMENHWMLGDSLLTMGRYREAIDVYEGIDEDKMIWDEGELRRSLAENPVYPNMMLVLAQAYRGLGRYSEVVPHLQERYDYYAARHADLLAQAESEGLAPDPDLDAAYRAGMVDSLWRMATPLVVLGRTEEAVARLLEARDTALEQGDDTLLVETYLRLGEIYLALNDTDNALTHYEEAAALAQQAYLNQQRGRALLGIGRIQMRRSEYDAAGSTFYQALSAAQSAQDVAGQVLVLTAQGDLALAGENPDPTAAERAYRQALNIGTQAEDARLVIDALLNIGDLLAQGEDPMQASLIYHEALARAERTGDRQAMARAYGLLGRLMLQTERYEVAGRHFTNAVDLVEQAQRGFQSETLQSQFAANYAWIYADYITLLVKQNRYTEAFDLAERARARAFLDHLAAGPLDLREGASAELVAQEAALRRQIQAARDALSEAQQARPIDLDYVNQLNRSLSALENSYAALLSRLEAENPVLATLTDVETASLAEVQAALPAETALLSYYTTAAQTYVFIITAEDFQVRALDVSSGELAELVERFRADERAGAGLDLLYRRLFDPIDRLMDVERLLIVPHGVLHYLPFAALGEDGELLGDDYTIRYLPSATALLYLPAPPDQSGPLLALGNPAAEGQSPLPFAEQEVHEVANVVEGEVATGEAASESLVWTQAEQAGVLYLAAHGELNARNPLFSTLHLAPDEEADGRLEVHEIYRLDLTQATELVVLSACQTGVGVLSAGDEFTGLSRAFLYAGAPGVVASLWSVNDEATSILMVEFFQARESGMADDEALRAAQQALRSYEDEDGDTPYASPYYWAAFVLVG